VVAVIRAKLAEPGLRRVVHADDLAALAAFYENRSSGPLWTTDVGLSAKGQQALFKIEKADDWGLDKDAFDLPPVEHLPAEPGDQAASEIRLDLAILKYARFARGGRFEPAKLSRKAYQSPPVLDPNAVLAEIARAEAPDAYLRSLHPKHDQFFRLREALLRTRKTAASEGKNPEQEIRRILINMERWRWMPEDLGYVHVLSNTPEFMLYVVKDGKIIHADKTQVGTINYATPVISDKMTAVVFNPEWIAPPTVLREDLLPLLRKKRYATLKKLGFSVSYRGKAVNPERIDWDKANILAYTLIQKPGPSNKIGKAKFLLTNEHAFILHDTWPERRKYFQEPARAIGYDCVRMEKPDLLAKVILAEGNQMLASEVEELWDNGSNSRIELERVIPVHSTYFTAVVDGSYKISTYPDLYGLDHKLARAMFGDAKGFPMPAIRAKRSRVVPKYIHPPIPSSDFLRAQ
jgi:murein L,D-transpeptidase YcbB/YkuD